MESRIVVSISQLEAVSLLVMIGEAMRNAERTGQQPTIQLKALDSLASTLVEGILPEYRGLVLKAFAGTKMLSDLYSESIAELAASSAN